MKYWGAGFVCGARLSPTSHPGEGGSGGMVQVFRFCSFFTVFRALRQNSGEPYFHLHAATCSLEPQACRGRLRLNGRDRKKRKALLSQGAALALDLGLERKKRDKMCVGGRSSGPSPRLRFQEPGQGVGVQAEKMEGWTCLRSWIAPGINLGSRLSGPCLLSMVLPLLGSWAALLDSGKLTFPRSSRGTRFLLPPQPIPPLQTK